ncbi:MAG: hypothetical protein WC637_09850 [Victivallales bacterium]
MGKILDKKYCIWIILLFTAAFPYLGSIKGEFVFSDIPLIQEDPFYREPRPFTDCWKRDYWMESMAQGLHRPLTVYSYWLNAKISGIYSPAFRAVNLAFHICTVFIVFILALRLGLSRMAALLAGVLFAVHPLHTEAVIPAFGRGEVLCGLFIFTGLLFHTYVAKKPLYSIGTAICFIFACWSKEHGVALIPLCILYDIYSGRLKIRGGRLQKGLGVYFVYLFALAVIVFVRIGAMGSLLPSMRNFTPFLDNQLALCSHPVRILSAIDIQGLALLKFIWPLTLSHDYSYAQLLPLKSVFDISGIAAALLVLSIPFLLMRLFPELKKEIGFFFLSYLICVLPAANIITPTGTIFAERLYYIPSIWLCFASACILMRVSQKMDARLFTAVVMLILFALGARTCLRSADWHDQLSITLAGTRTSPLSVKTWNNLAVELAHSNDFNNAIASCDRALEIHPSYRMALVNRAFYNIKLGNFDSAEKDLRKLISLGTPNPEVYNKLGAILANNGKSAEALELWKISLKLDGGQTLIGRAINDLQNEINLEEKKNDIQR